MLIWFSKTIAHKHSMISDISEPCVFFVNIVSLLLQIRRHIRIDSIHDTIKPH